MTKKWHRNYSKEYYHKNTKNKFVHCDICDINVKYGSKSNHQRCATYILNTIKHERDLYDLSQQEEETKEEEENEKYKKIDEADDDIDDKIVVNENDDDDDDDSFKQIKEYFKKLNETLITKNEKVIMILL
jgi:hypothetical protein